ncbi:hypothetical protein EVAR_68126_1 [Eumeta japonica]|uniref:Uncharacterized protein n=1 Tax=Eumeta variegata TaxID=151549 RepID=A0A4C1ZFE0_EUMVA|nr:hypothetical protein EVAR_68126_1 [Eumeta japonica]
MQGGCCGPRKMRGGPAPARALLGKLAPRCFKLRHSRYGYRALDVPTSGRRTSSFDVAADNRTLTSGVGDVKVKRRRCELKGRARASEALTAGVLPGGVFKPQSSHRFRVCRFRGQTFGINETCYLR